ncbi:F0F1 ATP synthase subunit A [Pseudanabaena galeata UHCC 0370]|uniref:ATP synthase subunit a n=1 Tax=Pseudanabaena galeata UHCC 0370 TaxID=3110310 RepID=A0ABU5TG07_9CYAN|nr:F0F1 ATP synthase subunit A [Pseudanabaena galeata]MEA5477079.1 F0F1 ATP synthase subunit A [Pseudanabaena galeata UHCC 0370]
MNISPDEIIYWQMEFVSINATLVFTWLVMLLLGIGSWLVTRHLSIELKLSRWQNLLEILVINLQEQIQETSGQTPNRYLPFVGTLFIFIATANILAIVPLYQTPTGSLSTTAALSILVFFAVPFFGIRQQGIAKYLYQYLEPSPILLPFTVISELSRTLALTVRLFGNVMSGGLIGAILLSLAPLFFPIVMQALGLLTGIIQAYVFSILTVIYISAASHES